jgi:hypothetical protein
VEKLFSVPIWWKNYSQYRSGGKTILSTDLVEKLFSALTWWKNYSYGETSRIKNP